MTYDIRADEALTLLPSNNDEALEACHSAVDQRLLDEDTDIIRREREAASCTANVLPYLAWERSVHHWTGTAAATDVARTAASFVDHGNYGSPDALEAEIRIDCAYADIAIREWWEVEGFSWPDFIVRVGVENDGVPYPAWADVIRSAVRRKNVRDWPSILFEHEETGPLGIAAAPVLNGRINSLPLDPTPHDFGTVSYGARGTLYAVIQSRPL